MLSHIFWRDKEFRCVLKDYAEFRQRLPSPPGYSVAHGRHMRRLNCSSLVLPIGSELARPAHPCRRDRVVRDRADPRPAHHPGESFLPPSVLRGSRTAASQKRRSGRPCTASARSGTSFSRSSRPASSHSWLSEWTSRATAPRSGSGPRGSAAWSGTSGPRRGRHHPSSRNNAGARHDL